MVGSGKPGDKLGSFHHPLQRLPVRDGAVPVPDCDAAGKKAFDGATVKVHQDLRRQVGLLKFLQEEELLVSLFYQDGGVQRPRKILGEVDPQELEAGDTLDLNSLDLDGSVCVSIGSPEVHDDLLGLLCVYGQVVISAPGCQVLDLLPVGCLIVVGDEADHRCVVCKFDGVGAVHWFAVVGEEGVEERAQHTALWDTSVQNECGGGVVI